MIGAGIFENDLLIVDRSLEPIDGKIIIAAVDGYLTVKRLCIKQEMSFLMPENTAYQPIQINPETGIYIWGVVTQVIHAV